MSGKDLSFEEIDRIVKKSAPPKQVVQGVKMSDQFIQCLVLTLQKAIIERTDVTDTLKGFDILVDLNNEAYVTNPPQTMMPKDDWVDEEDSED